MNSSHAADALAILTLLCVAACTPSSTSPTTHELTGASFLFDLKVFEPTHPTKPTQGIAHTRAHALARHPSGDILVTAHTTGPLDLDLDAPIPADSAFIARIDPSGRAVWAHATRGMRALVAAAPDGRVFAAVMHPRREDDPATSHALELIALSQDGEVLWSRSPRTPGGAYSVARIDHHAGRLVVIGSLFSEPDEELWDIPTTNRDAGAVTWWRGSDGELDRTYTFGGDGQDNATDVLPIEGGDVLIVGQGSGRIELAEGETLEHEGDYGVAVRLTRGGEVAWKRAWPARGYQSYSEARRIIRTKRGVAIVGAFGGDIDLYSEIGAQDAFGRVFVEELTWSGEHLNQYVVDGYNDQTVLRFAQPLEDGTIALGLGLRSGYANGPPTIELTEGPISPETGTRMSALVRLDLSRGRLGLLERWDGQLRNEHLGTIDLYAMLPAAERLYVAGSLDGTAKLGERVMSSHGREHDPCGSGRSGTLRHVIGGPYICRPVYQSSALGFVQRIEVAR